METVKFDTNIRCADCLKVAAILLNADPQILYWDIDTNHPDRLLIVKGWMVNPGMVVYNLRFAGFQVELVDKACSVSVEMGNTVAVSLKPYLFLIM